MPLHGISSGSTHNRRKSCQTLEENTAESIDICSFIGFLTGALLWRHVERAPETLSGLRKFLVLALFLQEFSQTEIDYLDLSLTIAAPVQHDVRRFEISVNHALKVGETQCLADLQDYIVECRSSQRPCLLRAPVAIGTYSPHCRRTRPAIKWACDIEGGIGMGNDRAIELFDQAVRNDNLVSPRENKNLLKDFTVEDWRAIVAKTADDGNGLIRKGPAVVEQEDKFVVQNDEQEVRTKDILDGVKGFLTGCGITAGGSLGSVWAVNRFLQGDGRLKLAGLGVSALAGYFTYKRMSSEARDIKENANPLIIPKSGLKESVAWNESSNSSLATRVSTADLLKKLG